MKSKKNIVLIGMMGSGKSSIGKLLSKKVDIDFIDIDQKIEEKENKTISEIFSKFGENYFRKLEEQVSLDCLKLQNKIISLGGGGFMNVKIRRNCLTNSLTFWLNWKNETIINRISKSKKRPLAIKLSNYDIDKLIKERSKKYKQSNYTINCDKLNKIQIIEKILKYYEKNRT
tara:strand:+ start:2211 stop:2729 length:519 start_codon:yes stop_codon:yes gene_type:complete